MSEQHTQTSKKKGCLIASIILAILIISFLVFTIGGCGLIAYGINESIEESEREIAEQIETLKGASPSSLQPYGELKQKFGVMSQYTDLQRERAEQELIGTVIEWNLNVYEVSFRETHYRIQTQNDHNVGTFISLYPQSNEEKEFIEALMTGNTIKVRGVISGVFMRNVEVNPAILVK